MPELYALSLLKGPTPSLHLIVRAEKRRRLLLCRPPKTSNLKTSSHHPEMGFSTGRCLSIPLYFGCSADLCRCLSARQAKRTPPETHTSALSVKLELHPTSAIGVFKNVKHKVDAAELGTTEKVASTPLGLNGTRQLNYEPCKAAFAL